MPIELKPCPRCGGEVFIEKNELGTWVVKCKRCPLDFGRYFYSRKYDVKKAWNRRVDNG